MRHWNCRRAVQAANSQNELSTNESSCQELYNSVFMYPAPEEYLATPLISLSKLIDKESFIRSRN